MHCSEPFYVGSYDAPLKFGPLSSRGSTSAFAPGVDGVEVAGVEAEEAAVGVAVAVAGSLPLQIHLTCRELVFLSSRHLSH